MKTESVELHLDRNGRSWFGWDESRRSVWAAVFLMIAAGLVAYSNTTHVPFLLDDSWRIVNNRAIHSLSRWKQAFQESNRSIVNLSFAANYALHGLWLPGYHVVNLTIHIAAGLTLFGFSRRALIRSRRDLADKADSMALVIATVWMTHPLQTSAVTYINQRFESLMGLFFLATFYFFALANDSANPRRWYLASILTCGLGMLCKEVMAVAPLLVLWYDRAFLSRSWRELVQRHGFFYVGLASTWLILGWAMLHYTEEYVKGGMIWVDGLNTWTYLLTQSDVIVRYLRLSLWPIGQVFVYDWPIRQSLNQVLPQALIVVALLSATLWTLFRHPKIGFLGGWFFLILAPTSSFFPIFDLIFEHRMYLSLAAVSSVLVLGLHWIIQALTKSHRLRNRMSILASLAIVMLLIGLTYRRNRDFRSEFNLWKITLNQEPGNAKAWQGMGCTLVKLDQLEVAATCFERAVALAPNAPTHRLNFGNSLVDLGRYDQAEAFLLKAIERFPSNAALFQSLGITLLDQGKIEQSLPYCERSIELDPTFDEARMTLAAALIANRNFERAIDECQIVLDRRTDYAKANLNMAIGLRQLNRLDEAIEQCRAAIRSEPNLGPAHAMLGAMLVTSSPSQALEHLQTAYQLAPETVELKSMLFDLLKKVEPRTAIQHYRRMLKADQYDIEIRYKLVSGLVTLQELDQAVYEMEKIVELRPNTAAAREYLNRLKQAAKRP